MPARVPSLLKTDKKISWQCSIHSCVACIRLFCIGPCQVQQLNTFSALQGLKLIYDYVLCPERLERLERGGPCWLLKLMEKNGGSKSKNERVRPFFGLVVPLHEVFCLALAALIGPIFSSLYNISIDLFPSPIASRTSSRAGSPFSYYVSLVLSPCVDYIISPWPPVAFIFFSESTHVVRTVHWCINVSVFVVWFSDTYSGWGGDCVDVRLASGILSSASKGAYFQPRKTGKQREYWKIYRGPGFLSLVWFGSYPTPFLTLPSVRWTGNTQEYRERETTRWRKRGGEGGARGAKSYDGKKTSSSINHLILSARMFAKCTPLGLTEFRLEFTA